MNRKELPRCNGWSVKIRLAGEEATAALRSHDPFRAFITPVTTEWEEASGHYLTEAEIETMEPNGIGNITSQIAIPYWHEIESDQ